MEGTVRSDGQRPGREIREGVAAEAYTQASLTRAAPSRDTVLRRTAHPIERQAGQSINARFCAARAQGSNSSDKQTASQSQR